ncbi:hypothetical protein QBC34DRAFT_333429 [Podospora aff. communis PSN243]|uniref:Uncharacterized protein n=1 Tax=Podospora aff. communis PSN243 TaxID=3040156 RepID=A0AAV9GAR9_9PEZI|nr:hypothetical protein QBC34DRAFT_333429 [Podospora aff. communis PSN243]
MGLFFDVQCDPLPEHPVLVSSPKIRGTYSIVWTCLSVVLLCTWTVLHLNVPIETEETKGFRGWLRRKAYLTTRATWWFLVALVAPELIACAEVVKRLAARHNVKETNRFRGEKERENNQVAEWSLSHAFLANMGGFAITFKHCEPPPVHDAATGSSTSRDITAAPSTLPGDEKGLLKSNVSQQVVEIKHPLGKRFDLPVADQNNSDKLAFLFRLRTLGTTLWHRDLEDSEAAKHNAKFVQSCVRDETRETLAKTGHSPTSFYDSVMGLRGHTWVLEGSQLLKAAELGIIDLPTVRTAEIEDRSKSDNITTALALGQSLWFGVQLLFRAVQDLPTTQLEALTFGFVICSAISFAMVWGKPKNVNTRIEIRAIRCPESVDEVRGIAIKGGIPQWFRRSPANINNDTVHACGFKHLKSSIGPSLPMHIAGCTIALIFGAVHFMAWFYQFPTPQEQFLWRIACIVLVALPLPISALMLCAQALRLASPKTDRKAKLVKLMPWLVDGVVILMDTIYVAARLFIMVEAARSLFFLPREAYTTTAAWDIPHIG